MKIMTIHKKCFLKFTLAKICHLDLVQEVLATLSESYVRTDRYVEEVLIPIRKMRPIEENDHVGLESVFGQILALCAESKALNMYHHKSNPLVTGIFIDSFPLNKIKDWYMQSWARDNFLALRQQQRNNVI